MEEIIINDTGNEQYDSLQVKARGIVINEDNKIYIMNMNDSYMLPGGTMDGNEEPDVTIVRELYEELGLKNVNPIPFKQFKFYHNNFPSNNGLTFDKRLNIVNCYLLHVNSNNIGKSHFTDYEIECHDCVECHTIDEIIDLLKERNCNLWKPFTDKELTIILTEYKRTVNIDK